MRPPNVTIDSSGVIELSIGSGSVIAGPRRVALAGSTARRASASRMAPATASIVSSTRFPSVAMIRASGAGRSGATARVASSSSRRRRAARISRASGLDGSSPRSSVRRRARSSTDASRNSFRSASGSTTVPMSRPAMMIPPAAAIARWRSRSAARSSGTAATSETARSTRGPRTSSVWSMPSTSTRDRRPASSAASWTSGTSDRRRAGCVFVTPRARASQVTARYSRPVSQKR